jgi:ubiquinone/menaquinone biosynthesis C-methylase UbiE/DNA-binding transcriptional ArsR family regulator
LCRLLADNTRVRLMHLLEAEELSVAELAAITNLAQPRVSTHLARLKEAGLVCDRRAGVSVYYRATRGDAASATHALWRTLAAQADDPLLQQDQHHVATVLAERSKERNWADSVAGDMERHYSPGRTWETTARALMRLLDLGDVLDIAAGDGVTAELLAAQARSMVCVDSSDKIILAGQQRTECMANVTYRKADMHALPLDDAAFDTVLMLHALTYSAQPAQAIAEAARVLRPGGMLLLATLEQHSHEQIVATYDHLTHGFSSEQLRHMAEQAGLQDIKVQLATREARPPHFTVLTMTACKPAQ